MRCFLLLLIPSILSGQIAYSFSPPQPSRVPGLQEYQAVITNFSDSPQQVWAMQVYGAAGGQGIQWVADVGLQKFLEQFRGKWGFWRIAGVTCEMGGYMGAIAVTGELARIKEKYKAVFPIAGSACTFGRVLYNREHRDIEVPRDLIPPLFTVPAHTIVNYVIYGR